MLSFKDWQQQTLAPGWLRRAWGAAFLGVTGTLKDRLIASSKEAAKVGFPETAPLDALGHIGDARNIERYVPDTDGTFRARLISVWREWEFAGTRTLLLERLAQHGLATVSLFAWRELTSPPAPYTNWWSAFWVFVSPSHPWSADGTWGSGVWGSSGTWGSTATVAEVLSIRNALRKWKPAEQIVARTIVILSGDVWGPYTPFASGNWGGGTVEWQG